MTSPYLERPLRPQHVVVRDILANMGDTHVLVILSGKGEPYIQEVEVGKTFDAIVAELIAGEHDHKHSQKGTWISPVAVLRIARDAPVENVTDKVSEAILRHLVNNHDAAFDEEGYLREQPFLENVRPDWRDALPVGKIDPPEYEHEVYLEAQERRFA